MRTAAWLAAILLLASLARAQPATTQPWVPVHGDATPHFTTLLAPGVAPAAIHVDAVGCPLAVGTPLTARYAWDFGDPAGKYNQLVGFVAAHVYDRAGTYAITLVVTDEAGHRGTARGSVTITPDMRRAVFVAPEGSDGNSGDTEATPLRSAAAAFARLAGRTVGRTRQPDPGHTILLFKAGGTYPIGDTVTIRGPDVVVGRYGDGPKPVLLLSHGPLDARGHGARGTIEMDGKCDGVMIEHLTFATPYAVGDDAEAPKVNIQAIFARGRNVAVRECSFRAVDDAVNANGRPVGLLVQDCDAPGLTDLRAYLIWGQGSDHAYIGNHVGNSTREHNVRMSELDRVLIYANDFANPDRGPIDKGDGSKGCIEMHWGSWAYIAGNRVRYGPIRTGPRGSDNEPPSSHTDWCVVDGNDVTDAQIRMNPGSHHIMVRNNVVRAGKVALFNVDAPDRAGRTSGDLTVVHNTGVNPETAGNFLVVWGRVDGLTLADNLYAAPHLRMGLTGSAIISAPRSTLDVFRLISHDVWPTPEAFEHGSDGGVCATDAGSHPARHGYLTPAEWAAAPQVVADRFVAGVALDDRGVPVPGGPADGAAVPFPGTGFDHDGRPRPAAGPQAAGAFQR